VRLEIWQNMDKAKTEVYLFGGLGNQLFQYFFGQYLLKVKGLEVEYNDEISRHFGNNHGNELLKYLDIGRGEQKKDNFINFKILILRINLKLDAIWLSASRLIHKKLYISSKPGWDDYLSNDKHFLKYFGYFQTWRFFEKIKGKEIFFSNLKYELSEKYHLTLLEIRSQDAIGIHLRRGDYIQLVATYGLLDVGYYKAALIELGANKSSTIFVFSDEIQSARIFFRDLEKEYSFEYLEELNAIESLILLGKCTKICISNSTFGYWGAHLGEPIEVVAPSKWFRNMQDPIDLIPPSWKRIEAIWKD
jgi:hypothetical protein